MKIQLIKTPQDEKFNINLSEIAVGTLFVGVGFQRELWRKEEDYSLNLHTGEKVMHGAENDWLVFPITEVISDLFALAGK